MATRELIRGGIARGAYLWKSLTIDGLDTIKPFGSLTDEERKPYYVLAYQLTIGLHSLGLRLPNGESLIDGY